MKNTVIYTLALGSLFVSCKNSNENNTTEIIGTNADVVNTIQLEDTVRTDNTDVVINSVYGINDSILDYNKSEKTTYITKDVNSVNSVTSRSASTFTPTLNSSEATIDNMSKSNSNGLNTEGVIRVSGWEAFNALTLEMDMLKNDNYTSKNLVNRLSALIATLDTSRPMWMNTEEINEDIADIQKEYNELVSETNTNEEEYLENIEELQEQFDDLREEVSEVYKEYVSIHNSAIEEYTEEMESDGDKDDALEEYNEEIQKLKTIRDGVDDKQ